MTLFLMDTRPVFVGCIGFAILMYLCKKFCDLYLPVGTMFMSTIELDDIELDIESDEAEKLLQKKKVRICDTCGGLIGNSLVFVAQRARKVTSRPTMQSAAIMQRDDDDRLYSRHHVGSDLGRAFDAIDMRGAQSTPARFAVSVVVVTAPLLTDTDAQTPISCAVYTSQGLTFS